MCGIVGYIGGKNAVGIIVDGLKRLEYRGYDSAGRGGDRPRPPRSGAPRARSRAWKRCCAPEPIAGNIGIGHTRWATHGRPTDENAHPHRRLRPPRCRAQRHHRELPAFKEHLAAEGHVSARRPTPRSSRT